jgi:hypothetical protein
MNNNKNNNNNNTNNNKRKQSKERQELNFLKSTLVELNDLITTDSNKSAAASASVEISNYLIFFVIKFKFDINFFISI